MGSFRSALVTRIHAASRRALTIFISELAKGVPMTPARFTFGLLLILGAAFVPAAEAGGDVVFDGIQVHTINVQFTQPAYWDSLVYYYNQGLEHYMPATVTLDGVALDSVGVRLKGNASYNHPNNKKPFRLSFDEYISSQRWDELKGVHLNNCWEDPTFIREKLHLDYCRDAGIPAPRGNFAELYLNGELWGFYSLVEHVDKLFLTSRYGVNSGNLYKAVDGFLNPTISDFKWYGSDPSLYYNRYELKTDDSPDPWTDLIAVIDSVNNSTAPVTAIPAVVNMNGLYRAIGTDILMANLDSYTGSGRNFYPYFNPSTGKMEWIIWDTGMSFGSYWSSAQNYETLSATYVSSATNRPLVGKIFNTPDLLAEYLQEFCSLYTEHFSTDQLFPQIDAIATVIRPYVYADPRKMYTNAQFETNIDSDITVGGHRKPGLKSFITARYADVASQLATLGVSCTYTIAPGDVVINEFAADNTLIPDPAGDFEDWIEMYNNTAADIALDGMYLSDTATTPTKWQFPAGTTISAGGYLIVWADNEPAEAGLHATWKLSASGEHIRFSDTAAAVLDSVTFGVQTTNLTMARIPNGTGPFVQGYPSFNDRNGVGQGDLVINEFAATNTLIADPVGDFEDWVELYNNTGQAIDLSGMYLSDAVSLPTQWQFPSGTTIPGNGYLIVWADNEPAEVGLHATWKLSASGEQVCLADATGAILDQVAFGAQTANLTMARLPNGTGSFIQGTPTFNAYNGDGNLLVPGKVVVNEFMASNEVITDPAGELEDWIELYNTTDQAINLGGLYLSDAFASPSKWQIPSGTTIAANGYLVVWADEDVLQAGLHATFKLSSSGEEIVLSNPSLSVVDSTSFGEQTTNASMARIPNGTGPFAQTMMPTIGADNSGSTSVEEVVPNRNALRFMNPFRGGGTIEYTVSSAGPVALQIFDLEGRLIATPVDRQAVAGTYRTAVETGGLASGAYLCRLRTVDGTLARRLILVK